ncbi:hypothetical protein HYH02_008691 [Chlamydomonas schloesseri]|uniref:U-box domain-containing protein n=1 Tax=Chlamydomonas schloesseri TaxID=2026947 RepID=A0A836B289_9CHLO|nr:hypothetical protein HYH02_008691 [Chlamydomonas schloesseri]|eukprot:KAG2445223.1 hypothetical protein HYH02_008691 [Chlamydomonas schloesseri]
MLAACKAALSGLGGGPGGSSSSSSSSSRRRHGHGHGGASPSDKQSEAFARAVSEGAAAQVAAYVGDTRSLLVCSLKTHPAKSTAWHLAAGYKGSRGRGGASAGSSSNGAEMLELLLALHRQHGFPGGEGLRELLACPNKRGQTCLHVAAAHGNADAVRLLLSEAGPPAPRSSSGAAGSSGSSSSPGSSGSAPAATGAPDLPAAAAASSRSGGCGGCGAGGCEFLLRADKSGRTAMHLAAAAGSEECVRLLLEAAEAADAAAAAAAASDGEVPCSPAGGGTGAGGPQQQQQQQLVSPRHVSPSSRSASARSPSSSQQLGPVTAVARLAGSADAAGLTPLHFAAAANCLGAARLLLGAGGAAITAAAAADVFEAAMPCNAGWTCLHVAAMRGHLDFVLTVLRHHLSLSTEEQLADWNPAASTTTSGGGGVAGVAVGLAAASFGGRQRRSTTDPRAVTDRRGTTAAALAAARGFAELAAALDPDRPLAAAVNGESALTGPDGRELRPPAMFVCPITQEVMREPAVASDGFTYERAAIAKWVAAGKLTSPMTNLPFTSRALYPNNVVRTAIMEWRAENGLPDPTAPPRGAGRRLASSGVVVDLHNAVGRGGAAGGASRGAGGGGGGGASGDPFLSHLRAHGL